MTSPAARLLLAAAGIVVVASSGCTETQSEDSLAAVAVLGCADSAAWGTVTTVTPEGSRLRVVMRTDRWVVPDTGATTVDFLADHPSAQVGAPDWKVGARGLVVLDGSAPPSLYADEPGKNLERVWRDAGARR
ncbi:hypothetical protein AB0J80_09595 [Actinoplanes sp. NPDC049548]|uniref:hypothetical protein n=1 Tax=Actinoplanes sp. NPDC049548 TaxID=3155152 RepID=UPI003431BE93